jgi:hypothetical protein
MIGNGDKKGGQIMIKSRIILIFAIIIVNIIFIYFYYESKNYVLINQVAKAQWSNEGSYIILHNPSNEDNLFYIHFGAFNDKDLFDGRENSYLVDEFITEINQKYENRIKLNKYKKESSKIILFYEDQSRIIWDFIKKQYSYSRKQ